MKKILVLCTGNSCRSQMAEGYLKYFAGDMAEVFSAGINANGVHPLAIQAMKEDGIDISNFSSKLLDVFSGIQFDFVITVCDSAKENCPYFPGGTITFHKNFPDPAVAQGNYEEKMIFFRTTREMIKMYCKEFVRNNL